MKYKAQKGLTLMELLVSVIILAAVIVGVVMLIDQATSSTKTSISAAYIKSVGEAANAYMRDNRDNALLAAATDTTPAVITIADLMGTGTPATGKNYLRGGKNTTPDGQTICVMVLKEAGTGNYQGLVVTEGGNNLDDLTLAGIISQVGGAGGGVYSANTSQVRGAMGGWVLTGASMTNFQKKNCAGGTIAAPPPPLPGAVPAVPDYTVLKAGHPTMALWFQDMTSGTTAAAATPSGGGGYDPESGLPIGGCSPTNMTIAFKRVGGVVYGRVRVSFAHPYDMPTWIAVPGHWDPPGAEYDPADPLADDIYFVFLGGKIYGAKFARDAEPSCKAYVP